MKILPAYSLKLMVGLIWLLTGFSILLLGVAIAYFILSLLLLSETILAIFQRPRKNSSSQGEKDFSFSVLMPAHNEESVIQSTLNQLILEVDDPNQILVVADNCDDATANIARAAGVRVLERRDVLLLGKGYALDFGLKALQLNPPDVVVMVDADCRATPGTIKRISHQAFELARPVQALYLMDQPTKPSLRDRVSALAWTVKNRVRGAGLSCMGVPIPLTGSGMAFPWQSLQAVELASGHLVEDMKLGIDLAIAGYTSTLDLGSQVTGILPDDATAAKNQRTRWEHGQLQVLKTYVPKLIYESVKQLRVDLLILALDLAVPPLALWSMLGIFLTLLTSLLAFFGISALPFQIQLTANALLITTILLCWAVWGRGILNFSQLMSVPLYILWKIPIYLKAFLTPETSWIRTKRNSS